MNAGRRAWLLYAVFLAVGLGAMGWVTRRAMAAEEAERVALARTLVEEKVRLALWRMDSTLALFLTPENARPWHQFETFHRVEGRRVPSPMLVMDDPMVVLRFQVEAGGPFTSPLAPTPADRVLASRIATDPARLAGATARLSDLGHRLDEARFRTRLREAGAVLVSRAEMDDLRARSRREGVSLGSPFEVNHGAWTPFWLDGDLLLGRQVWVGRREVLQGIWLDWKGVQDLLQSVTVELLPGSTFAPLEAGGGESRDRRMSSLPVKLVPGRQTVALPGRAPSRALLFVGWGMVLIGALAGGWVLRRGLELGERRVAFASAVTHELRSPLTTFKLYSELLARGMVPDPAERQELLETLLREADRLDHLVKNVLAYARLETGREGALEPVGVDDLLTRIQPRLAERAQAGGLRLEVDIPAPVGGSLLRVDPLLVEQVLFNLVDNAAKYAGGGSDPRLRLEGSLIPGRVGLRLRDFGPGIGRADRRHLFQPFHKSAQHAARTAPGVGLGLALCRGLARGLGGDLILEDTLEPGASFLLTLPTA